MINEELSMLIGWARSSRDSLRKCKRIDDGDTGREMVIVPVSWVKGLVRRVENVDIKSR